MPGAKRNKVPRYLFWDGVYTVTGECNKLGPLGPSDDVLQPSHYQMMSDDGKPKKIKVSPTTSSGRSGGARHQAKD